MTTRIHLKPDFFAMEEKILITNEDFQVSTFVFDSGVKAVRMKNSRGFLVMLPYQGQQIWSAEFDGRNLTMKSMFEQPRPTRVYLETYGGFLLHCGATAMGAPTEADHHPLHGELPNAPFQDAYLELGVDQNGSFIALGGHYQHTVAFSCNYVARPLVKLYAGSSVFRISLAVENLKYTDMEFMYLAHVNFRLVANARLVYSAECTPKTVRVRSSIPSHVKSKPGYREFLDELAKNPERHHVMAPDLMFDPEVVFMIDYLTDEQGWAHSLQILPDGTADYLAHRPAELDHGIRWICRTPDQEALGLVLPATAEPEGYTSEKAKGNIKVIPARGVYTCEMIAGSLSRSEANDMTGRIGKILNHDA
jgi:hypothetical protein